LRAPAQHAEASERLRRENIRSSAEWLARYKRFLL
jgi:hypothetical protein